jgi:hypothetical protein
MLCEEIKPISISTILSTTSRIKSLSSKKITTYSFGNPMMDTRLKKKRKEKKTLPTSNIKIVKSNKTDTPYTQMHDR